MHVCVFLATLPVEFPLIVGRMVLLKQQRRMLMLTLAAVVLYAVFYYKGAYLPTCVSSDITN